MIKGFIEITDSANNQKILINIDWIEAVHNNVIDIANYPDANTHIHYACKESFEEIKQKIKEAI